MKASTQCNLLYVVGGVFGYLGVFHSTVGLPDWVEFPCGLIFVVCVWSVVWLQRRAKKQGDPTSAPTTPAQKRRHTWLLVVVFSVACLAWPFVPPGAYGGAALPLVARLIIGTVMIMVFVPLIIVIRRRREKT